MILFILIKNKIKLIYYNLIKTYNLLLIIYIKMLYNYKNMNVKELKSVCKDKGIKGYSKMKKNELINVLEQSQHFK